MPGPVALAYARTRHTDSDYERGRRQQQLIAAAIKKVVKRGPAALPDLVARFDGLLKTDVAMRDAPALLALAERARIGSFKSTILGPSKYAGEGDVQYSTKLKIDVVRDYFRRQFGPVKH
jgi:anionic cell wall polymer biosynthesis LytR-Cps2A-Psr (LCP) family protein